VRASPATGRQQPTPSVTVDFPLWRATWVGLGVESAPREDFDRLLARYKEPHRAYHTLSHVEHCLSLLAETRDQCEHPDEVALALWFHDVVYEPHRSDNEAASARWLVELARLAGVPEPGVARMRSLIMATRHAAPALQGDEKVLVDIDLAILGAAPQRFDAYEAQIRREYRWVPGPVYRAARIRILSAFLDRPSIFATALFQSRFETAARANIARSLECLARS
jgi:predicted metal-dependent HD superfamily phosphohydrolase